MMHGAPVRLAKRSNEPDTPAPSPSPSSDAAADAEAEDPDTARRRSKAAHMRTYRAERKQRGLPTHDDILRMYSTLRVGEEMLRDNPPLLQEFRELVRRRAVYGHDTNVRSALRNLKPADVLPGDGDLPTSPVADDRGGSSSTSSSSPAAAGKSAAADADAAAAATAARNVDAELPDDVRERLAEAVALNRRLRGIARELAIRDGVLSPTGRILVTQQELLAKHATKPRRGGGARGAEGDEGWEQEGAGKEPAATANRKTRQKQRPPTGRRRTDAVALPSASPSTTTTTTTTTTRASNEKRLGRPPTWTMRKLERRYLTDEMGRARLSGGSDSDGGDEGSPELERFQALREDYRKCQSYMTVRRRLLDGKRRVPSELDARIAQCQASTMQLREQALEWAVADGLITSEEATVLWQKVQRQLQEQQQHISEREQQQQSPPTPPDLPTGERGFGRGGTVAVVSGRVRGRARFFEGLRSERLFAQRAWPANALGMATQTVKQLFGEAGSLLREGMSGSRHSWLGFRRPGRPSVPSTPYLPTTSFAVPHR
jgi:hypothetical protein